MTREEAKEILENWKICHYTPSREATEVIISALDPLEIITALRPVSREQVEKVWRGKWEFDAAATEGEFGGIRCSKCHTAVSFGGKHTFHNAKTFEHFCSHCGAPMTDEAVEMVMERVEALHDTSN